MQKSVESMILLAGVSLTALFVKELADGTCVIYNKNGYLFIERKAPIFSFSTKCNLLGLYNRLSSATGYQPKAA